MPHPSAPSLRGAATVFVVKDVLRSVAIHFQAASESKRQPGHGGVNIFVTDVDALYHELKARGASTLNEPKDYPYGMRDFDINDPDGNQLCFGMESKQPPTTR